MGSDHSGWSGESGSGSVTSRAAPPMEPSRSACTRALVSTSAPRAILTIHAVGFIRSSACSSTIYAVFDVAGAAITKWSDRDQIWGIWSAPTVSAAPATGVPDRVTASILAPNAVRMGIIARPMPPQPTIATVAPDLRVEFRFAPGCCAHLRAQRPHAGEEKKDGVLGDVLRVRAGRRRPYAGVVDDVGGKPRFNTCGGQLYPPHPLREAVREGVGAPSPDDGVCVGQRDQNPAASLDSPGQERIPGGSEMDLGVKVRHCSLSIGWTVIVDTRRQTTAVRPPST